MEKKESIAKTRKKEKVNGLASYVGSKIKEYRNKKGLTQKQLGKIIGKEDNTISNYETGTINIEQDTIFAISRALDIRIDDLFPPLQGRNETEKSINDSANTSLSEIQFLNELAKNIQTLSPSDRKRFIDNIKLAVEFFNKSDK